MPIFRDVPKWYEDRLRKMYRKNTDKILRCPNIHRINHLTKGCALCSKFSIYTGEGFVGYCYDRMYLIRDSAYDRFCLRRLTDKERYLQTSIEFPTPKITSKNITRIPQFYEPATGIIYDCFPSIDDIAVNSSAYYINRAHKVCAEYGLRYYQLLINKKEFEVVNRQPMKDVDEAEHKMLLKTDLPF